MQRWREQYLGLSEFLPAMSSAEVDQFFTLSREEFATVESRRGPLSVGLQIGFLRMTGRVLNSCQILPVAVLEHLGVQLGVAPPQLASIRGLYRRKRTLFDHQRVALTALGFRDLTEHAERGLTAHQSRLIIAQRGECRSSTWSIGELLFDIDRASQIGNKSLYQYKQTYQSTELLRIALHEELLLFIR